MKNVTLSADDSLIEQARTLARLRGTTLNEEFRKWLASYSSEDVGGLKLAQTRAMRTDLIDGSRPDGCRHDGSFQSAGGRLDRAGQSLTAPG